MKNLTGYNNNTQAYPKMTKTDEKSSKGDGITVRQPTAVLGTLEPFDVERPGE